MNDNKVKVLYIAGAGRSGSTILDNILGQMEGFFSVGEIHRLWDSGPVENRVCGCGEPLILCEAWTAVLEDALGGPEEIKKQDMMYMKKQAYQTRHLARMLLPGGEKWIQHQLGEHVERLSHIYQGLARTTGSRVIVDSSKFPSYGYVLDTIPEIDLYLLHLVRDSRAVAYSWQRDKFDPGTGEPLGKMSPAKSSALWAIWNIVTPIMWRSSRRPNRYMRLHYEDFVAEPRTAVHKILHFLDEDGVQPPFVNEHEVMLSPTHSVCGNPVRFDRGVTKLRLDARWKTDIKTSDKLIATTLTWPLLWKYGYFSEDKNERQGGCIE